MADLKFIQCENPKDLAQIKSGELTDYMFMMYRKGEDGWYKNAILPHFSQTGCFRFGGAFAGVRVMQSVRISLDKNGKAVLWKADEAIEKINDLGRSFGFAQVDSVNACYGIHELIKKERRFITEDSDLVAHIELFSTDTLPLFPVGEAMLTVSLEYREREEFKSRRAVTDICPVTELVPGTVRFENAAFTGRAAASAMGYDDVLWLDPVYRKYILGLGDKTVFLRIDDAVVTPPVKCGYMAEAVKSLISAWGIPIEERGISADELWELYESGAVSEIFAVSDNDRLCSVTEIDLGDKMLNLKSGKLARKLFDTVINIERGVHISTAIITERI